MDLPPFLGKYYWQTFFFLTCRTFSWDHSRIKFRIQWFLQWKCKLSPQLHSDADQACVLKPAWFNPRPLETLGCCSTDSEQTECPQPENTLRAEKHSHQPGLQNYLRVLSDFTLTKLTFKYFDTVHYVPGKKEPIKMWTPVVPNPN